MTEDAAFVACEWNNHPTATTVQISIEDKDRRKSRAEIKSKKITQVAANTEKSGQDKVKSGTVIKGDL